MLGNAFPALIQNVALLLAMAFIYDVITNRYRLQKPGLPVQLCIGVAIGILGIIIMLSSWHYVTGIVFDSRSVLLGVAGLFFGPVPTVVAMAMTGAFRLSLGGAAAWPGVAVILASGMLGLVWRRYRCPKSGDFSWRELYLFGLLIHVVMLALMLFLPWNMALRVLAQISLPVLIIFPLATAMLGSLLVLRQRREQIAAELQASEERMRLFFERQIVGMAITSPQKKWLQVNDELCRMLGYSREELAGVAWPELTHPDDLQADLARFEQLLSGVIEEYSLEKRFMRKDGGSIWTQLSVGCVRLADGAVDYILTLMMDITERKQVEGALRESEERYRTLVSNLPGLAYRCLNDADLTRCFFSEEVERMTGYPASDFIGNSVRSYVSIIHPDDRGLVERAVQAGIVDRQPFEMEYRLQRADGLTVWVHEKGRGIYGPDGALRWLDGVIFDITRHVRAEEEKSHLQAQLFQAQKMESVGRLAGGVAHDFNNMLQTILGYCDLSLARLVGASPVQEWLLEIRKAALRSADLTRQLLAFARKQPVSPKILDLNDSIAAMLRMLQRLIGENIDLAWLPGHSLWPVKIDPSQLDQILANLALNARDSIADTGKITIETRNASLDASYCALNPDCIPGQYVQLTVSDDGCGMDRETLSQIFEPFFTTKELGKGTGLGLATVYGVVRQNQGFVNVYSEPGQGTTFSIYLPSCASDMVAPEEPGPAEEPATGTETVLLVEDEETLLFLGQKILQGLGYTVLAANTPMAAIQLAREYGGEIDLLITDVVMPEMNGRDLAQHLSSLRPAMQCLYMSGYTANVIAHHGVLDPGIHFIQKPFSVGGLAGAIREALRDKGKNS
jgi:PAS domain S-box-containing protein